jgi:TatA/E family protein of Tat protein translocase
MDIGDPELIIILVIVVLAFGPRRLGEVASELGKGIPNLRDRLAGKEDGPPQQATKQQAPQRAAKVTVR